MDWWTHFLNMLHSEFSDIKDLTELFRMMIRLLLAAILGGLLGLERESCGKNAGIRTHMLVAMGSAFFMMVPWLLGVDAGNTSRIMQGVITGIGFLGAGSIMKADKENEVKGLTTAAGIWLTSAIGIACGLGLQTLAILGTLLAFAILWALPRLSKLGKKQQ